MAPAAAGAEVPPTDLGGGRGGAEACALMRADPFLQELLATIQHETNPNMESMMERNASMTFVRSLAFVRSFRRAARGSSSVLRGGGSRRLSALLPAARPAGARRRWCRWAGNRPIFSL